MASGKVQQQIDKGEIEHATPVTKKGEVIPIVKLTGENSLLAFHQAVMAQEGTRRPSSRKKTMCCPAIFVINCQTLVGHTEPDCS